MGHAFGIHGPFADLGDEVFNRDYLAIDTYWHLPDKRFKPLGLCLFTSQIG